MADKPIKKHHEKSNVCYTRPSYREARWERAVKVYTINLESKYIVVNGVATVGVSQELIDKFSSYGNIQEYFKLEDYPTEPFTEAYLMKYESINNARFAKRKMDNKSFYGGILHVFYAPEYESEEECRLKLEDRRKVIARKTRGASNQDKTESSTDAERTKPGHSASWLVSDNAQGVASKVIPNTVTATSQNTRTSRTVTQEPGSFSTNVSPNHVNYLCNLPPLPPPPVETRPTLTSGQFLRQRGHQNSALRDSRFVSPPQQQQTCQPLKRNPEFNDVTRNRSHVPSKKQRKRI